VRTSPDAIRVLCFGDSNTHGAPADDPDYVRLGPDRRWTGLLQALLGEGYEVVEEGLNGRTTDVDYADRPHCNGRTYFPATLMSHHPLDAVVVMLGSNDLKTEFARSARDVAEALHGYVDDVASYVTDPRGRTPLVLLVSPIHADERVLAADDDGLPSSFDERGVAETRRLGAEIARVAAQRGVLFADAATVAVAGGDGLHIADDAHQPLARLVADLLTAGSSHAPAR
jgi:lysophospholipase L1-like esterase